MPEIHEYRCDGPTCEVTGSLRPDLFGGKRLIPSGWLVLDARHEFIGSRAWQAAFHNQACLKAWVAREEFDVSIPLIDHEALAEAVKKRADSGSE